MYNISNFNISLYNYNSLDDENNSEAKRLTLQGVFMYLLLLILNQ